MFNRSRILTAVVTVVIAGVSGYFTQTSLEATRDIAQARVAEGTEFEPLSVRPGRSMLLSTKDQVMPQPTSASLVVRVPSAPKGTMIGTVLPAAPLARVRAVEAVFQIPPSDADLDYDGFGMDCDSDLEAVPASGGMIRLTLTAACEPGATILVEHDALSFKAALAPTGRSVLHVPALRTDASVRVTMGTNPPIDLNVQVPDASLYERVALVGPGMDTMSVHALEFGAGPGSAGHVSAARTAGPTDPGSTVLRLGAPDLDEPILAEVYSFPTGRDGREGTVRISVAARVTEENCSGTARIRAIHTTGGGVAPKITDLSVPMPDCGAVGRILVLKNLVEDLKIARN
ncbi:MAG: hypothetical protein AAGK37_15440 [Pseudomonadota bacterium]